MSTTSIERRWEPRIRHCTQIRVSVNGAAPHDAATIDLNGRSLAIQTSVEAAPGDRVTVWLDGAPPILGRVVRVFADGFAVSIGATSPSLAAYVHLHTGAVAATVETGTPVASEPAFDGAPPVRAAVTSADELLRPFRIDAPTTAYCMIVSPDDPWKDKFRRIQIVTSGPLPSGAAASVWLTIGSARWPARRGMMKSISGYMYLTAHVRDWQLALAAAAGLGVVIVANGREAWRAEIAADAIAARIGPLVDGNKARIELPAANEPEWARARPAR